MKSLASEPGRLIGAGNEDVGTEIGLCLSCASRFFAHFFAVIARLRRENA